MVAGNTAASVCSKGTSLTAALGRALLPRRPRCHLCDARRISLCLLTCCNKSSNAALTAAVKAAFEDLLQQVNKHKEILRASHKWQRGRRGNSARPSAAVSEVPFEQTLAAVFPATISSDDVRSD